MSRLPSSEIRYSDFETSKQEFIDALENSMIDDLHSQNPLIQRSLIAADVRLFLRAHTVDRTRLDLVPSPPRSAHSTMGSSTSLRAPGATLSRIGGRIATTTPLRTPGATPSRIRGRIAATAPLRTPGATPSRIRGRIAATAPLRTPGATPSRIAAASPATFRIPLTYPPKKRKSITPASRVMPTIAFSSRTPRRGLFDDSIQPRTIDSRRLRESYDDFNGDRNSVFTMESANIAGKAAAGNQSVGIPQFHLNGDARGNNSNNWAAGGNVGVGTKIWESSNKSVAVGVGVNHTQGFGRTNGQSWKSRPNSSVGIGFRYNF